MRLAYNIGVRVYWLAAWITSVWNPKAKKWVRGRKGWYSALREKFGSSERVIWFHCASLGEFEQGRPLIEETRNRLPNHKILLTFFSPSGYEKRKSYDKADHVMYLPLDTARNARLITGALKLDMVIFIKYEFWYQAVGNGDTPVPGIGDFPARTAFLQMVREVVPEIPGVFHAYFRTAE